MGKNTLMASPGMARTPGAGFWLIALPSFGLPLLAMVMPAASYAAAAAPGVCPKTFGT